MENKISNIQNFLNAVETNKFMTIIFYDTFYVKISLKELIW